MSWIDRMLEERLSNAAAAGEFDAPTLKGKPLPDLDQQRSQGWWAERFVQRELSHDRRQAADERTAVALIEFWQCATLSELKRRVIAANERIDRTNINLTDADQIQRFDISDIAARWRKVRDVSAGRYGRTSRKR